MIIFSDLEENSWEPIRKICRVINPIIDKFMQKHGFSKEIESFYCKEIDSETIGVIFFIPREFSRFSVDQYAYLGVLDKELQSLSQDIGLTFKTSEILFSMPVEVIYRWSNNLGSWTKDGKHFSYLFEFDPSSQQLTSKFQAFCDDLVAILLPLIARLSDRRVLRDFLVDRGEHYPKTLYLLPMLDLLLGEKNKALVHITNLRQQFERGSFSQEFRMNFEKLQEYIFEKNVAD